MCPSGPQNSTFGTSALLRSLGVQSSENPKLDSAQVIQTFLIADLSKSFANQKFEARAIGSVKIQPQPNFGAAFSLNANAPGGVVVESVQFFSGRIPPGGDPALETVFMQNSVAGFPFTPTGAAIKRMEIGGSPTESTLEEGETLGGMTGVVAVEFRLDADHIYENNNLNWFIESGNSFQMGAPPVLTSEIQCSITWREIPQVAGPP